MAAKKKSPKAAPPAKRGRGRPKGSKNKKTGRPRLLNEALIRELCKYLEEGNYIETAAAMAGISKSSLFSWLRQGHKANAALEKGHEINEDERFCVSLLHRLKKAEADAEVQALRQIRLASKESWQAAAWRLERRHPTKWARRTTPEPGGDGGGVKVQRIIIGDTEIEF